ncbi:hypothetical protein AVEN_44868-1 [Araneus ventricosus]|uniref:Uncharacterized protein n=1 Tax=Araneus ventricosus TaxID=182803 RepID=A0A4Y2KBY6_ARAVE|nr:hypothetical protein AVEN_44868-1 [Araneus ventricosus]
MKVCWCKIRAVGRVILSHPKRQMCSFMFLAVWRLALSSKNKTPLGLLPFLQSCDQREVLRHPSSPSSCIEVGTIGRHFRSNEEVRQAVKNFLRSLATDFYQDGFLKLISRYDKCINVGGEYVGK